MAASGPPADHVRDNAALSMLRVVARALVDRPGQWRFILARARMQPAAVAGTLGGDALAALEGVFAGAAVEAAPATRAELHARATALIAGEVPRMGTRLSPPALAGQVLLSALGVLPSGAKIAS